MLSFSCLKKTQGGENLNKNLLESIMKLNGDTGNDLAVYLGIARSTFSLKLNETNGAEFVQGEIIKIKQRYNLSAEQIDNIFFTEKMS